MCPARKPLLDLVTCIREHCTIDAGRLPARGQRRAPPQIAGKRWRTCSATTPTRLPARTLEIVALCTLLSRRTEVRVSRGAGRRRADARRRSWNGSTWIGAAERYPRSRYPHRRAAKGRDRARLRARPDRRARLRALLPDRARTSCASPVRKDILCQGRGSAANSAVCYCLGITAVDPTRVDLLFERFVSAERNEPPDIDVDFEHERREEVIQYIYAKYGRDRAGLPPR